MRCFILLFLKSSYLSLLSFNEFFQLFSEFSYFIIFKTSLGEWRRYRALGPYCICQLCRLVELGCIRFQALLSNRWRPSREKEEVAKITSLSRYPTGQRHILSRYTLNSSHHLCLVVFLRLPYGYLFSPLYDDPESFLICRERDIFKFRGPLACDKFHSILLLSFFFVEVPNSCFLVESYFTWILGFFR